MTPEHIRVAGFLGLLLCAAYWTLIWWLNPGRGGLDIGRRVIVGLDTAAEAFNNADTGYREKTRRYIRVTVKNRSNEMLRSVSASLVNVWERDASGKWVAALGATKMPLLWALHKPPVYTVDLPAGDEQQIGVLCGWDNEPVRPAIDHASVVTFSGPPGEYAVRIRIASADTKAIEPVFRVVWGANGPVSYELEKPK